MRHLFIACILLCTVTSGIAQKKLKLENIWGDGTFHSETVSGVNNMKDGLHYTSSVTLDNGKQAIVKYAYKTGKATDTLLNTAWLNVDLQFDNYQVGPNERKILLGTGEERIYRHSSKYHYFLYDRDARSLIKLIEGNKQMFATFSPSGEYVAMVRDNNLVVVDLKLHLEEQITTDGIHNQIINGRTDWVYEEEYGFDKAFFWSPDGKKIAFYRFDESEVKEIVFARYEGNLYPSAYKFKYPKAGEQNAKVSIHVYDLETKKTTRTGVRATADQYIPRLKWTRDPNLMCIYFMNRHQNDLELIAFNTATQERYTLLHETDPAYIDIDDDQYFLNDKQHFIWSSEADGYKHLYLYNMKGEKVRQITKGTWDVTDFYGVDEENQTLYYGSAEVSPKDRHVYSIKLDGTGKKLLTEGKGWNTANFSKGMKYFIHFWSDANTPGTVTLRDQNGKSIRVLKDNASLNNTLKEYQLSKKEFFVFTNSGETLLNGWMIKPPDFDPNKKYPVLMFVYGGPGSQKVTNSWTGALFLWHQYMAQQGYVVVAVDNRGTGARGATFKKCTYRQLGKLELDDQIDAARYLGSQSFVDASRIGIHGWSYGGYMSSLCITKGAQYFKTAIAVAPVTNWRFYDSIYTERYMQTPQENASGYDDNSPINHVKLIKGHYLLIHGTADDNVHFQNSMEMVHALVRENIPFDMHVYPDKNHSIFGGNTRLHLYSKMTSYLLSNL
ncbi:MAG: S9 family peptidase [Flavobacteriales bacterium]|nr:S9 family peptidase [Flavobacteriales bacterium]